MDGLADPWPDRQGIVFPWLAAASVANVAEEWLPQFTLGVVCSLLRCTVLVK